MEASTAEKVIGVNSIWVILFLALSAVSTSIASASGSVAILIVTGTIIFCGHFLLLRTAKDEGSADRLFIVTWHAVSLSLVTMGSGYCISLLLWAIGLLNLDGAGLMFFGLQFGLPTLLLGLIGWSISDKWLRSTNT